MKACWRNILGSTSIDGDKSDIASCGFLDRLVKDAVLADQSPWDVDMMTCYNESAYRFGESCDFLTSFIASSMTSTNEMHRRPSASLIEDVFDRIDGDSSLQSAVCSQASTATTTTTWPPSDDRTVWNDGGSSLPLSVHPILTTDTAVADRCDNSIERNLDANSSLQSLEQSTMMQSQLIG